ncbi:transcription elongation factor GreA [Effusibacillus lacus]|uniref:Transcription elongation factor GreA n=1 Tax=Effusibacillus lacus TaxID=1348429 RepID=A0A292YSM6_9BACL|nr:transcription elongation factor GreA [Effusibacillus lacus]TCS76388.1 transcription elongation factor GreA [Effusibacillus lacus]GAX91929.1 transcription elongation factor GreA [Effusibacillus lacus]
MTDNKFYVTQEGLRKLEEELEYLKTTKRAEVKERLKIARSYGDLSENSEYEAAKDEQGMVESRIIMLENQLRNAVLIREEDKVSGVVTIGSTVTIQEVPNGDKEVYTIVGPAESDPLEGRISNESPIGRGLLGKQKGDTVTVPAPGGEMTFKILKVE